MAYSAAALKVAAICMLVLCAGSELAVPVLASPTQEEAAAAGALLQELVEYGELAGELGLLGNDIDDTCTPACRSCLVVCAITCVLNKDPVACFFNCTVTSACFSKAMIA